jgi:hypothetical protein
MHAEHWQQPGASEQQLVRVTRQAAQQLRHTCTFTALHCNLPALLRRHLYVSQCRNMNWGMYSIQHTSAVHMSV